MASNSVDPRALDLGSSHPQKPLGAGRGVLRGREGMEEGGEAMPAPGSEDEEAAWRGPPGSGRPGPVEPSAWPGAPAEALRRPLASRSPRSGLGGWRLSILVYSHLLHLVPVGRWATASGLLVTVPKRTVISIIFIRLEYLT